MFFQTEKKIGKKREIESLCLLSSCVQTRIHLIDTFTPNDDKKTLRPFWLSSLVVSLNFIRIVFAFREFSVHRHNFGDSCVTFVSSSTETFEKEKKGGNVI